MSQKIDIRERRFNGVDYDVLHPETNINMVLDSSNNSVGDVNGALYGDGNGNIVGAAISNPNLLDNPWFTVNQRGATSGTERTYIADRWYLDYGDGGVTWSRTANTITIQSTNGTSYGEVYQVLTDELVSSINGKTVTVSVLLNDFSVINTSFLFSTGSDFYKVIGNGLDENNIVYRYFDAVKRFEIGKHRTAETIRAIKLEVGSISTLANDVAPKYKDELLRCQWYEKRITATANAAYVADVTVHNPTTVSALINIGAMRVEPVVSTSGSFHVYIGEVDTTVTYSSKSYKADGIIMLVFTATGGLTAGQSGKLYIASAGGYIDFSAEL